MRISLNWLNDYIDVRDLAIDVLAKTLTDSGLEVEAIESIAPLQGKVVVGRVVTTDKHPNADSLKLCKVDIGEGEPLNIVCGAPNARVGLKVAVATIGSELPGGFKIKAAKIRGEASQGMLCSERELGVSEEHEGILEVAETVGIGHPVATLLHLNDTVLTLNVTPNRADCLGYRGVARDLSAKLKRPLKAMKLPTLTPETDRSVTVRIEDPLDCARFCTLHLTDVKPTAAPHWMRARLAAAGMRSINKIVDVTNYVMLEYGQPIHAYDERDISSSALFVRLGKAGETLKTLDGTEQKLAAGDLLICDANRAIGLAGIMGGENSEVKSDTQNVVIEVAWFAGPVIRKTAKRLALHTEASHRFERGVDVAAIPEVAQRVYALLGGSPGPLIDIYPAPIVPTRIAIRRERTQAMLGLATLSQDDIIRTLESLQFKLLDKTDERSLFEVPTWRGDIMREIDLIEEVGRIMGFERIPYAMPKMSIAVTPENPFIEFQDDARIAMAQRNFTEIISFPFVGDADLTNLNLVEGHPLRTNVRLANPLSEADAYLQPTVLVNLLKAAQRNRSRGQQGSRLFECARGFYDFAALPLLKNDSESYWIDLDRPPIHWTQRALAEKRPIERHWLGFILDQPMTEKSWNVPAQSADFFAGKAVVSLWLKSMGIMDVRVAAVRAADLPFLHPSKSAVIYAGMRRLGYLGEVHPKTAAAYDLSDKLGVPVVAELDLEAVFEAQREPRKYAAIAEKFPPSTRDLALVVDVGITHSALTGALREFPRRRHLADYKLFDVYQGKNIPDGKKSMAYALSFQSEKRTLNDKEVDAEIAALLTWLDEKIGAKLR